LQRTTNALEVTLNAVIATIRGHTSADSADRR
jgi:hypothetical protein